MIFYPNGAEWHSCHDHEPRIWTNCARCGRQIKKRCAYAVYILTPGGGCPKRMTHICPFCAPELADWLEAPIP